MSKSDGMPRHISTLGFVAGMALLFTGCAGLVPDDVRTQIQVDGAYALGVQHGRAAREAEIVKQIQAEQAARAKPKATTAPVGSQ